MNTTSPFLTANDDNMAGVVYLFGIGFIIAFISWSKSKNRLVGFHLAQFLGLAASFFFVVALGFTFIQVFIILNSWVSFVIFWLLLFCFIILFTIWIAGLINGFSKKEKELPLIGKMATSFFGKLFD